MLRKGRNALSTATHVVLNIGLAVLSTVLTVVSGSWVFGILLVLLSKWRVVAVRPRYWWLNIKGNLVDFTVGIGLALLVYAAGHDGFNIWHGILTAIYAIWLVGIKPLSALWATEVQAVAAVFIGTFAMMVYCSWLNPIWVTLIGFVIGYGASRHILIQNEEREFTLSTMTFGLVLAELSWIFYQWLIAYQLPLKSLSMLSVPQLPIVSSLVFFVFYRGYRSAARHDGKITIDDILLPSIFSILIIFAMLILYSNPRFNF